MAPRSIVLLALGLLLAACQTAGQQAQRDNERCAARGLQPDSDAYKECLVQVESDRKVRTDARHREMMERSAIPSSTR
jgi:hypothetical protein